MDNTVNFNGHLYQYYDSGFSSMLKAKQKKKELMDRGYYVRIVKTRLGITIYRRHKNK